MAAMLEEAVLVAVIFRAILIENNLVAEEKRLSFLANVLRCGQVLLQAF
jgi:hypothetical protein